MRDLVQQLILGLSIGATYALIALGYTMVYGVLRLINFAHGEVYMAGAVVGWYLAGVMTSTAMPAWLSLTVVFGGAMLACAALGCAIQNRLATDIHNARAGWPRVSDRELAW